jgi:DNA invertase Pin-like site-specific DNA recombinase
MTVAKTVSSDSRASVDRAANDLVAHLASPKIQAAHREKLAVDYIRQSCPQQVLENRESTERQYAFADRAVTFGWPQERVLVIDEDLGKSGRTAEGRTGFQRLMTEVTLGHVGIVLGLEISRLARSSKDWHALFELCAMFGTLLADEDGVYDPNDPNDRLILGLKGIMSEMELHTMRNRLEHGKLNKAKRGELFHGVPMGYVLLPTGKVSFDPDEQARSVIHLVFEKFEELGSIYGLFHYLVRNQVFLPVRPRTGGNKGQLEWRRPSLPTLCQLLHHPIYAGAYAYGRRPVDPQGKYSGGKRKKKWLPMDEWKVLIKDLLPAYISWDRYLKNQERLEQNKSGVATMGTPRKGVALLSGVLVCGNCKRRMQVCYRTRHKPHYSCVRHLVEATEQTCYGLKSTEIDDLVTEQVLRALEPAAVELSLAARGDVQRERERLDKNWKQKLKRAQYDVDLAARRYQGVDPDNRLVAATLERDWEQALRTQRQVQDEYDRFLAESPPELTDEERQRIATLSSDVPTLWYASKTTNADRQAIVRCLVDKVIVHVKRDSEYVDATIHWAGGYVSQHELIRPVRMYEQLRDYDKLLDRIAELRTAGHTSAAIADKLNEEGFTPPKRYRPFSKEIVRELMQRRGLADERKDPILLQPHERWLKDLADQLRVSRAKLRDWAVRGWIHAHKSPAQGLWIVWADDDELTRIRDLLTLSDRGVNGYPPELTTPKARTTAKR